MFNGIQPTALIGHKTFWYIYFNLNVFFLSQISILNWIREKKTVWQYERCKIKERERERERARSVCLFVGYCSHESKQKAENHTLCLLMSWCVVNNFEWEFWVRRRDTTQTENSLKILTQASHKKKEEKGTKKIIFTKRRRAGNDRCKNSNWIMVADPKMCKETEKRVKQMLKPTTNVTFCVLQLNETQIKQ